MVLYTHTGEYHKKGIIYGDGRHANSVIRRLAWGLAPFSFQFYHESGSWQFPWLLWTSTTTFVKGEAQHIFLQRTLSSPELKILLLNVVFWCLLGGIKHMMSTAYCQRYNQEEGEGPFFQNGNICSLNRILGLLMREILTCPPKLFPRACSN